MFKIKKNDFLNNGICVYEDEHGNTILMKRFTDFEEKDGFTARVRFKEGRIIVKADKIEYPLNRESGGMSLNLETPVGYQVTKEESEVLQAYADKILYWDDMICAIKMLQCEDEYFKNVMCDNAKSDEEKEKFEEMDKDDISEYKLGILSRFEELKDIVSMVFQV